MKTWLNALGLVGGLVLSTAPVVFAADGAEAGSATRPAVAASRPASEIVLVRVGDTVITQEDFNQDAGGMPLDGVEMRKASIVRALIGQRLLSLYLDEHPELVDAKELDGKVQQIMKKEGVKTREELEAKLNAQGMQGKLEAFLSRARIMQGRQEIIRRAERLSKDDEYMKALYDRDPDAYNGSTRFVRQIRSSILPWETPQQVKAKRENLEKIREDLVAGRRTWEQCVTESDCPSKTAGGEIGYVPRHLDQPEVLCEAAFQLQLGEFSEVLEDRNGFYLIQVTKTHQGDLTFEQARTRMNLWVQWEPLHKIDLEMRAKHPIVGVREPDLPPPPASLPAPALDADRGQSPGAATRPAAVQKPAGRSKAASRPARAPRATTTPAGGR